MPKSVRRPRRRGASALRSRTDARDSRRLLDRILDTPQLARVVPRLQPEVLHRVIQRCGLEECGELVALATPDQLARVFDLDLWRAGQPGTDEHFDADRFGVWLEVLLESGAAVAAQKLADINVDLVTAALAQHVRVFDRAAVSPPAPMDGEGGAEATVGTLDDGLACDVGGYLVVAGRTGWWDAIVAVLSLLDAERPDYFHRVMRGCRSLSNSAREVDGLDHLLTDREQVTFDLAFDRERRREKQGYVTPAHARAFLQMSRQLQFGHDTTPSGNPVARAYLRAIEWTAGPDANTGSIPVPEASAPPAQEATDAIAAVVDVLAVLSQAGVIVQQPRALLEGPHGQAPRLARIQVRMQSARDRDHAAYSLRTEECAYLANTIVAGCSIQARPFTPQEASDAAVAVCNLGLENLPGPAPPDDFLVDHDLISVFQVGWTVLHDEVSMYAAERLINVLTELRCDDREIRAGLDALCIELETHWKAGAPWRARDAMDVIAALDMPAWAVLLALIDECPVLHAGIGATRSSKTRAVSASAFEFISGNSQIASVREFMQSLPATLCR